jgi:DNA-binding response OmpR family regulator
MSQRARTPKLVSPPAVETAPTSRFWPRLVFARDDSAGSRPGPGEAHRILIVEDDFLIAQQMKDALQRAGYEIAGIAASADEAFAHSDTEKPALALMDIRLIGETDGVEVATELYRRHGIRSIFTTAHNDEDTRARARAAAPLGWLAKPYTMNALIDAVRRGLDTCSHDEQD